MVRARGRRPRRVRRSPILAALAGIALTGCALADRYLPDATPAPVEIATSYHAPPAPRPALRRVAVLPFQDLTRHEAETRALRQALVDEIQKRQAFEVVSLGRDALAEHEEVDFFRSGVFRQDTLIRLAGRFAADGVLYGAVTRYHPYEPLSLGLQLTLVSAEDGEVVWSANGFYDAADAAVVQDVHNFHDVRLAPSGSLEGWRLILVSPSRFGAYVCSRLADTLAAPRPGRAGVVTAGGR